MVLMQKERTQKLLIALLTQKEDSLRQLAQGLMQKDIILRRKVITLMLKIKILKLLGKDPMRRVIGLKYMESIAMQKDIKQELVEM
jgi:hypothetical protein